MLLLNNSRSHKAFRESEDGTVSRRQEEVEELALLTHSDSNISGLYPPTLDINVSKIEVLRGPRIEETSPPKDLNSQREMSQPYLRKTKTDVRKSKEAMEVMMKSLRESHRNSPVSKENVSTAMERKVQEHQRRSPVIIKAYESKDQLLPMKSARAIEQVNQSNTAS